MNRAGWLRRCAVVVMALVVAFAFTSALARAGSSYFYCTMMGTVGHAPCCAHAHDADEDAAPSARAGEVDCCKRASVAALPNARGDAARIDAPVAPLLAVLPSSAAIAE